ncbi:DNAase [Vibrio cionasavignyae]|uniref:DNAase n=1 Tax=Vibrio cionasavignyae TaxID=2910252 RepID=UPI003D147027
MITMVTRSDIAVARLRSAFSACPSDFEVMKQRIDEERVSLYLLKGEGYHLNIAGEVIGGSYFIWAVEGTGAIKATRELAKYVKSGGLKAITTKTYFPLVARLLKRLGTVSTIEHCDHQFLRWEV